MSQDQSKPLAGVVVMQIGVLFSFIAIPVFAIGTLSENYSLEFGACLIASCVLFTGGMIWLAINAVYQRLSTCQPAQTRALPERRVS